jgi:small subunit ribosomal protein S11
MPPKTRSGAGVKKIRRKEKKNVSHGHAHIKSTFNNTIVSIQDVTPTPHNGCRPPKRRRV